MDHDLVAYYRERAREYDAIYEKPERQKDLLVATQLLQRLFAGTNVLEIACGTGYWTERIARTAASILATDINEEVITVAQSRHYTPAMVSFQRADLFSLTSHGFHEHLFGGFIWSHILLQDLPRFVDVILRLVRPGGLIVFIDNLYAPGSSLPITKADEAGNTYQTRRLTSGNEYSIVKNFPSASFICETLGQKVADFHFTRLNYYWLATCVKK